MEIKHVNETNEQKRCLLKMTWCVVFWQIVMISEMNVIIMWKENLIKAKIDIRRPTKYSTSHTPGCEVVNSDMRSGG